VAATASLPGERSFEEFVALHAERFAAYLRGLLGRQAEGRGGRVAVDDTLQEALLAIYVEWPDLQHARDEERDRRLYRCLRDAAGQALRAEHGRRSPVAGRPRVVAFDFGSVQAGDEDRPSHERELTAVVLGTMVRELAAEEPDQDSRAMLDRGILIAALRALTEREAVVLLAVDHLGWDQHELAARLGVEFNALRQMLFCARKVFYALIRHAVGVEVEEEERARLAAYLAGELRGADKRDARRHLQHCRACQELQREQRVFGRDAVGVLAPLPFVFGARVLVKRSGAKSAALGGGAGIGLFAQPGAAKALMIVFGVLGLGVGGLSVIAELQDHGTHRGGGASVSSTTAVTYAAPPPGMKRLSPSPNAAPSTSKHKAERPKHKTKSSKRTASTPEPHSSSATSTPASNAQTTTSTAPPSGQQPGNSGQASTPSTSKKPSGGDCEFFCG
jgi:DNA-directed RNA polymerase specialized sigma24 family protein